MRKTPDEHIDQIERDETIITMAQKLDVIRDGECEIHSEAIVSEGSDNGAYVAAWVWVSFSGTPFDKETQAGKAITPEEFRLKGDIYK